MDDNTDLGELISVIYERFLAQYKDEELASVATAAVINDVFRSSGTPRHKEDTEHSS